MTGDWRAHLRDKLDEFVDTFVVAGTKQEDVFDAIIEEFGNLRAAVELDPDPADDKTAAVKERANDWPAAD